MIVKKCPECGNPSYDGAPVCGNCGYVFPKQKVKASKREDIFQQDRKEKKEKKASNDERTLNIIKENRLIIGIIVLITLIVICGIVLTGSNNSTYNPSSPIQTNDLVEYSENGFTFKYPATWSEVNLTDSDHSGAKFFETEDNMTVEYYNITSSATSLKEINQNRLSHALEQNDFVEHVETITLDGRNSSNIVLENADGDYTRYVSMFSDGELYVFKITGDSFNSVTSEAIDSVINSADIA